jgi:hypothetical protein
MEAREVDIRQHQCDLQRLLDGLLGVKAHDIVQHARRHHGRLCSPRTTKQPIRDRSRRPCQKTANLQRKRKLTSMETVGIEPTSAVA